jgi:hypothetical protein
MENGVRFKGERGGLENHVARGVRRVECCSSHCKACNRCFYNTRAFTEHRVGSFDERTRRCMCESELHTNPQFRLNARGQWQLAPKRKHKASARSRGYERAMARVSDFDL